MTDYIPELSQILLDNGIIKRPITAVLRKGREHYVCEHRLRNYLASDIGVSEQYRLEKLLAPSAEIDLAEIDIAPRIKRKISVPTHCHDILAISKNPRHHLCTAFFRPRNGAKILNNNGYSQFFHRHVDEKIRYKSDDGGFRRLPIAIVAKTADTLNSVSRRNLWKLTYKSAITTTFLPTLSVG